VPSDKLPENDRMLEHEIIQQLRVPPGEKIRLKDYDSGWKQTEELRLLGKDVVKATAQAYLEKTIAELAEAQELLYADNTYSVLIILQAMDAAGKDGTIKHVMSGVNPQGCHVVSFKKPSVEELDHNFLELGKLPPGKRGKSFWQDRYDDINAFEQHLIRNGTIILKFFLNVSRKEQKRRLLERLENPAKNWKFSAADLAERAYWDQYMEAYEDAINATSTEWAPWHIIPADYKWGTRTLVAGILAHAIRRLDLKFPEVSDEQKQALHKAKKELEQE